MADVSVIVPTLATDEGIAPFVRALAAGDLDHELVVVDNGRRLTSVLASMHPRLRVVTPDENLGFGRAVNRAAAAADGAILVVTNDDCLPSAGFLRALAGPVRESPGNTTGAGVLLQARDPALIDSAGIWVDRTLLPFDYLHGERVEVLEAPVPDPIGPSGGATAVARDVFLGLGGYDERLFAYQEDVDLALRLRRAGVATRLCSEARAVHAHSATLGAGSRDKNYLMGFGRGFVLKRWSVVSPTRLLPLVARDATICAGQLALDRTAAGIRGRRDGYRAVAREFPYPSAELAGHTDGGPTMGARLRRRLRLRGG